MTQFLDLPLEILPVILKNISEPHLTVACCVNVNFYASAVPILYECVSRSNKWKVLKLFRTLHHCPHLAKYVRRLEIRDFFEADSIYVDVILHGLDNCVNLRSCAWTRDGTLTWSILEALQKCAALEELEINGKNTGSYNPDLLLGFTHLRKISLIMPAAPVVDILGPWLGITGATLRNLTLICKASTIITDAVLESLASNLVVLQHLYIAGCPKVTDRGIWALLSTSVDGILGLGLEGLSPRFDMTDFSRQCTNSGVLTSLRSIQLLVSSNQHIPIQTWMQDVLTLLAPSALEKLQICSDGTIFEDDMTNNIWASIVTAHGAHLTKLSIYRMTISAQAIDDICQRCTALEQLFVSITLEVLATLGRSLRKASKLRVLHFNYPQSFPEGNQRTDALALLQDCSPTITQFGFNANIWQVDRVVVVDEDGRISTEPRMGPYHRVDVPEQFLVVRR